MSDDLLQRASQALRDAKGGASDRSAETRAKLLASAQRSRPKHGRWMVVVLPIAAALAVSGVWAGATGRLTSTWQSLVSTPQPPAEPTALVAATAVASGNSLTPDSIPAQVEPGPEAVEPAPSAVSPTPSAQRSVAAAPRETPADADHAVYLTAHRAHFGGSDSAAALAEWDRYLRAFPRGRFALEASYNRALCLVKLGRHAEASQALEPFARGAYGTYRQAEAKALREALGAQ